MLPSGPPHPSPHPSPHLFIATKPSDTGECLCTSAWKKHWPHVMKETGLDLTVNKEAHLLAAQDLMSMSAHKV